MDRVGRGEDRALRVEGGVDARTCRGDVGHGLEGKMIVCGGGGSPSLASLN